jgi:hypothetical protein
MLAVAYSLMKPQAPFLNAWRPVAAGTRLLRSAFITCLDVIGMTRKEWDKTKHAIDNLGK